MPLNGGMTLALRSGFRCASVARRFLSSTPGSSLMKTSISLRVRRALAQALVLGAALAGVAQAQNALDEILKTKKIAIAVPTDFPPYGFVGPDLKPQGLDIDMANLVASKLGATLELVPVTTANRIPYLQTTRRRNSSSPRSARTRSARRRSTSLPLTRRSSSPCSRRRRSPSPRQRT
jgi:hypothetical protein